MILQGFQYDYSCIRDPNSPTSYSPRQSISMPPIVARQSPLSSHSSMAIHGESGHQKHYCSCNTDLSMRQSSPEPAGEPDIYGAGVRSSQRTHLPPASITPLDQTSGRCTASHLHRSSLTQTVRSVTKLLEQPLAARGTSQGPGYYFEFLKHALTSKAGRGSLYALPIEAATVIIDGLEQVSAM